MQTITIQSPNPQAPEGHDAAMAAKADAATAAALATAQGSTPPVTPPARPDHIPEKFWDAEKGEIRVDDLAKSYAALEAKQGTPPVTPKETPAVTPTEADPAAAAAAQKAGLDLSSLETEYRTDGKVSEASLAKLKAAGFSEADVATYIAGREAQVAQFETAVMADTPGGADKYGEMMEWAKANLSPAEINAYNKAMESGDVAQARLAVAGVGVRFSASVGSEPNLAGGRVTAAPGDVYESMAQVTADMKKPEYTKDPAFRAKVQAKLGRSSV